MQKVIILEQLNIENRMKILELDNEIEYLHLSNEKN